MRKIFSGYVKNFPLYVFIERSDITHTRLQFAKRSWCSNAFINMLCSMHTSCEVMAWFFYFEQDRNIKSYEFIMTCVRLTIRDVIVITHVWECLKTCTKVSKVVNESVFFWPLFSTFFQNLQDFLLRFACSKTKNLQLFAVTTTKKAVFRFTAKFARSSVSFLQPRVPVSAIHGGSFDSVFRHAFCYAY